MMSAALETMKKLAERLRSAYSSVSEIERIKKNAFDVQMRCCQPPPNAHILARMLCFFGRRRLVFARDLLFLR